MRRTLAVLVIACLVVVGGCLAPAADSPDADVDDDTPADDVETDSTGEANAPADDDTVTPTDEPADLATADGTVEVHVLDVGQADAALVVGPTGETMLIDSGDWRDDGETVLAYLDDHEIDRIDYLVSTHAHADHIGGHAAVIERYETELDGVGAVYDSGVAHTSQTYDRYLDAVEDHDVTLYESQAGDSIPMDGVDIEVLNPPADAETDDLHYNSLSLRIAFGDDTFLFTGDAEDRAEQRMASEYGDELNATVYQAGHHGSSTSSTPQFLDAVDPEIAVISSAEDSQYGHPHDEVLDRYAERGVETYWTGLHGTVVFESDGEQLTVRTEANATTDPAEMDDEAAPALATLPSQ